MEQSKSPNVRQNLACQTTSVLSRSDTCHECPCVYANWKRGMAGLFLLRTATYSGCNTTSLTRPHSYQCRLPHTDFTQPCTWLAVLTTVCRLGHTNLESVSRRPDWRLRWQYKTSENTVRREDVVDWPLCRSADENTTRSLSVRRDMFDRLCSRRPACSNCFAEW